jgi:hypothetical protein
MICEHAQIMNLEHGLLDLAIFAHLDLKLHDITAGGCANETCQTPRA